MTAQSSEWDTAGAGLVIADGIADADFEVRDLTRDRIHVLQVTSAPAACQITISTTGRVTWECWPAPSLVPSPGQVAGMALSLLADGAPVPAGRRPGPTLTGAAGQMLRRAGLHAAPVVPGADEAGGEDFAELVVTSPDRPGCGMVTLTDDGVLVWECPLAAGPPGLTASDIAIAIRRALTWLCSPAPVPARHLVSA
jgi:hypothetical protein